MPTEIDHDATEHLKALATLTGRSVQELSIEAVRLLRESLVPSTRQTAAAKAGRKARNEAKATP